MPTFLVRERFGDFIVHPTSPKSMSLEVEPGTILSNTGSSITGIPDSINYGSAQILSSVQTVGPFVAPAAGNIRKDLIAVSTDLSIHILAGTAVAAPGPASAPVIPANLIPLAYINLTAGMTEIEAGDIEDIRSFLTPRQDRTRQIKIESLLPGTSAPGSGTSGWFTTTNFITGADRDVKFSLTVPQDFDYNRSLKLYLKGFTGGAGGAGNVNWQVAVDHIALGAGAGAFPPASVSTNTILAVNDDFSHETYEIVIADSAGTKHFNLRTLLPGDILAFNVIRRGSLITDTYGGTVSIVEVSLDYNIGYSVYPG